MSAAEIKPFHRIGELANVSRQEMEQRSSLFVKNFYMGDHLQVCKMLSRFKIYLDTRDAGIAPNILMDGYWESWVTKFIAQTVKPGYHCIDAGANFGYYSVVLAELTGKSGQTIAIEANEYLCKLLKLTNNMNEYKFHIVHKALSDTAGGEVTLQIPANYWGGGTIRTEKVDDDVITQRVQTDTIDAIVAQAGFPKVDFIKMDCEGVEPMIFKGMQRTLQQNPGLKMVMEYSPFMYKDTAAFTEMLFDRFEVGEITGESTVRPFTKNDSGHLLNLTDHIDLYLQLKK
jgi:FkbM family methyltransferase